MVHINVFSCSIETGACGTHLCWAGLYGIRACFSCVLAWWCCFGSQGIRCGVSAYRGSVLWLWGVIAFVLANLVHVVGFWWHHAKSGRIWGAVHLSAVKVGQKLTVKMLVASGLCNIISLSFDDGNVEAFGLAISSVMKLELCNMRCFLNGTHSFKNCVNKLCTAVCIYIYI